MRLDRVDSSSTAGAPGTPPGPRIAEPPPIAGAARRPSVRAGLALVLAVALPALVGPGRSAQAQASDAPIASADCLAQAEVLSYIQACASRIVASWKAPGHPLVPVARVRLYADATGALTGTEIVQVSDAQTEASVRQAILDAQPLPAMPEAVRCLAGNPFEVRFAIAEGGGLEEAPWIASSVLVWIIVLVGVALLGIVVVQYQRQLRGG